MKKLFFLHILKNFILKKYKPTPRLKLKSLATFLAVKRCQQTNIRKVIKLPRSSFCKLVHICANSGNAAVHSILVGSGHINSLSSELPTSFLTPMYHLLYEHSSLEISFIPAHSFCSCGIDSCSFVCAWLTCLPSIFVGVSNNFAIQMYD